MASEIDDLFKLPPVEFTAARNALAAKLKKDGDAAAADRVKTLGKPSISAWIANQLYWRHRKAFDRLLAAGEQFRKAQAAQLAGKPGDLRGSLDARRETLSELTRRAERTGCAPVLNAGTRTSSRSARLNCRLATGVASGSAASAWNSRAFRARSTSAEPIVTGPGNPPTTKSRTSRSSTRDPSSSIAI